MSGWLFKRKDTFLPVGHGSVWEVELNSDLTGNTLELTLTHFIQIEPDIFVIFVLIFDLRLLLQVRQQKRVRILNKHRRVI